ncbi:MAG: sugar transferase, partial [Nitrospirota bacterium]
YFSTHRLPFRIADLHVHAGVASVLVTVCLYLNNNYKPMRSEKIPRLLKDLLFGHLQAFGIIVALIYLLRYEFISREIVVGFFACSFSLLMARKIGMKLFLLKIRAKGWNYRNILIIGINHLSKNLARQLHDYKYLGLRVIGFLGSSEGDIGKLFEDSPIIGTFEDLDFLLKTTPIDEVIFTEKEISWESLQGMLNICEQYGIKMSLLLRPPGVFKLNFSKLKIEEIADSRLVSFVTSERPLFPLMLKKIIDVAFAGTALLLLAPLMALIIPAIKLDSPGPVFFIQKRSGRNGRIFDFLKFRSMHVDAEDHKEKLLHRNEHSGPIFKMKADPRVTRVGRVLRKYSLDELPQLINVLKGDMSLVGPRPPLPSEVEKYERWQRRRLSVKPGITCLWQVSGRNNIDFDNWMKLDLEYIDNWSIRLDFELLIKTIPAVLRGTGY